MTNVIPFQSRPGRGEAGRIRDSGALIAELAAIAEQIRAASDGAAGLPYPAIRVERTVQSLLDAITAVERAAQTLAHDGEPPAS